MDTFFVLLFKTSSYICYCQGENMKISLPVYSKGEEVINSMTHGVGAVLSLIGTFIVTNLTKEKISLISGLIFCISLFLLYIYLLTIVNINLYLITIYSYIILILYYLYYF